MRKSKFTPEQILRALRQVESGTSVVKICRKLGVTETTFYRWKKQNIGLDVSELRELKQLRDENRRLKHSVADLTIDKLQNEDREAYIETMFRTVLEQPHVAAAS